MSSSMQPGGKNNTGSDQMSSSMQPRGKKRRVAPFPLKLYYVLTHAKRWGYEHIISWLPHGRAFRLHETKLFELYVMPIFFYASTVKSFFRQLNLYSFKRLFNGEDEGAYYNELFLRGKPYLYVNIKRVNIKGNKYRACSNPDEEPDFNSMSQVNPPTEDNDT
mmetsp:Transcript_5094/g.5618  ORF Transcript_5094/g.5618 Transcript_5094/m.5618 type:complete len:163 (-) Transcript_5094:235-723(-)